MGRQGLLSKFRNRIRGGGGAPASNISPRLETNANSTGNATSASKLDGSVHGAEETKQSDPDDPTNIMKIIVNLKDELKAAHEVIRQQRVQVESAMNSKAEQQHGPENTNASSGSKGQDESSSITTADSSTVPMKNYRQLCQRFTQLEIDRCWAEFQLRDRITNDALKFHRRIRAVIQKSKSQNNISGSDYTSSLRSSNGNLFPVTDEEQQQKVEEEFKIKVDSELRTRLKTVADHLRVFEGRMVEMEKHVSAEMDSLGSIRDSLRIQRDEMELEIGTKEIERHMIDKNDNDILEQLTTLLVGPVKNLGTYSSTSTVENDDNVI